MKITPGNKSTSIILFMIIILVFFISCSTMILENNQEELELIKNVFYEAGYYYYNTETDIYTIYDINKKQIGYVFLVEGMSYSGTGLFSKLPAPMTILIGLVDKNTIKNIYVVNHDEDIGFWNMLIEQGYFEQFVNLKIEDAALRSEGGQIDSVTGATLSAMSVVDIVREAALEKAKKIK